MDVIQMARELGKAIQQQECYAAFLQANVEKCQLKSKTIAPGQIEANYQLRLREGGADFLQGLCGIPGVESAVLVSYNGEYLG